MPLKSSGIMVNMNVIAVKTMPVTKMVQVFAILLKGHCNINMINAVNINHVIREKTNSKKVKAIYNSNSSLNEALDIVL